MHANPSSAAACRNVCYWVKVCSESSSTHARHGYSLQLHLPFGGLLDRFTVHNIINMKVQFYCRLRTEYCMMSLTRWVL